MTCRLTAVVGAVTGFVLGLLRENRRKHAYNRDQRGVTEANRRSDAHRSAVGRRVPTPAEVEARMSALRENLDRRRLEIAAVLSLVDEHIADLEPDEQERALAAYCVRDRQWKAIAAEIIDLGTRRLGRS